MSTQKRRPGDKPGAAHPTTSGAAGHLSVADTADVPVQLRRRRAAAQRLPILDCGCGDPWHHIPLPPSQRNLLAARRAWWHLMEHGLRSDLTDAVLAEAVAS